MVLMAGIVQWVRAQHCCAPTKTYVLQYYLSLNYEMKILTPNL